ncbi:MAG: uroporphyrinogen-III C-methyltransferase [Methyloligellaceae bacterium]
MTPPDRSNESARHRPAEGFARLDQAGFPPFGPGTVWLVGAGPGAPGLLTLMGYHALTRADAVIHDALVNDAILEWARPDALIEFAGKRGGKPSARQQDISLRLVELARAGKRVLRLKGGDPFIFGRGGEECEVLAASNIPFRIVPGITAGVAGLSYAGIPATHRETNHSILFLTGHDSGGQVPASVDWQAVATASPVIVMYMAVRNLPDIARRLIRYGRSEADRVAVISNATFPDQSVYETTLGDVPDDASITALPTPALVVIGPSIAFRGKLDWFTGAIRGNPLG